MTNPMIRGLLLEVMEEDKKYKLTLIEDIIKGVKMIYGLGDADSIIAIKSPEILFDELYELSINELQILDATTTLKANKLIDKAIKK